jgi:hypothetical protein
LRVLTRHQRCREQPARNFGRKDIGLGGLGHRRELYAR